MDAPAVDRTVTHVALPRPLAVIEEQLQDLAEVLRAARAYGTPDAASRLGMASLLNHERELLDEKHAAELLASTADAEVSLEGDATAGHEVPAGLLGDFLVCLQKLTYAVAQVRAGRPTSRAPIRRDTVAEHRLLVQPAFQATSFGVRFRLPTREELGQLVDTDAAETVGMVCATLDPAAPSDDLAELLSNPRVKSHYHKLMDLLARQNIGVVARTRSRPAGVRLKPDQARGRLEWLVLLQVREEVIQQDGRLVGGSLERDRFELRCQDGTLVGAVTAAAKAQLQGLHLGQAVTARIRVRTVEHEEVSTEPTVSYLAEDFRPLQPPAPAP
ncbi:MAG: hypothetical protein IT204_22290 [Fimbriimonadaceae bacterium]|nr:hypothetical protein [Fimbriimonadaceae bacterium]